MLRYDVKGEIFMVHILWQRLLRKNVVFISRMDEHGEKIVLLLQPGVLIQVNIAMSFHKHRRHSGKI